MAEPITIAAILLGGYFLSESGEKPNQATSERSKVAPNDIPNSDARYHEVDNQVRSTANKAFVDAGDPFGTNVIPTDFNTFYPQTDFKGNKLPIVPSDFAESEGIPFTHSNMTPFFGGKLTQNTDAKAGQYRFDAAFGGNQAAFWKPKREIKNMFEPVPMRDPRKVEHRDWDHYERSMSGIQSGIKPFQDIRVAPGLGLGTDGIQGVDGFHYGNTRAFRPNVDELRVKGDKQKEEFNQAPARGNAFFTDSRTHEWDEVPKNNPETYWVGFDHERNPAIQGRKASRQREDFTKTLGCTQRGVGNELPLGPPKNDTYIGIKDDYNIDEYNLRDVKLKGIPNRPLGPQGKLSGRGAQKLYSGQGSSVDIRNNLTGEVLVENYMPTPVGNQKQPENLRNLGKVRGRDDNTRMHRPKRTNPFDATRYRDTTNNKSSYDCYKIHTRRANDIRNPNMPVGWEIEQHQKNPFTQSLQSVWK